MFFSTFKQFVAMMSQKLMILSLMIAGRNCQSPNDEARICASIWQPVCGYDGKTYSNECSANFDYKCKVKRYNIIQQTK